MTNKQKQCLLCYLGHYSGAIDGIWGKQSRQAEAAFRRERGLLDEDILEDALRKAVSEAPEDWWSGIAHFRREEFACKCGRYCDGWPAEMDRTVVEAAEALRSHFGAPAIVSSGLRCPKHNANSGGVANSRHLRGKAIDLRVVGKSSQEVLVFLKALPQIRYAYAINGQCVHMDVN